jgi:phytoene desaturase
VVFALEPTPNLDGRIDWGRRRQEFRDTLVERLAGLGYPVDDVVTERFVDPEDWERQGMERGTPFALSHRFFQTGPFRPGNVDKRVPGLVLVGSGTQPGVGVPMVLASGRLAADRVDQLTAEQ